MGERRKEMEGIIRLTREAPGREELWKGRCTYMYGEGEG